MIAIKAITGKKNGNYWAFGYYDFRCLLTEQYFHGSIEVVEAECKTQLKAEYQSDVSDVRRWAWEEKCIKYY